MAYAVKYEFLSLEDYLQGERDLDVRHEYVDGQIYAVSGASEVHNTVCGELYAAIHGRLNDDCRAFMADMKLQVQHAGKNYFYYPDIMVACGDNQGNPYVRTNPVLIVEVLSQATRRIDLGEKLTNYIQLPSLLEYCVVAQDTPHVSIFRRRADWKRENYQAGETFILNSVGLALPVEAVYRRVRREVGLGVAGL